MPIVQLIVILCVIAVALYLIETYLPGNPLIKRIIFWIIVFATVIWLLQAFGLWGGFSTFRLGK